MALHTVNPKKVQIIVGGHKVSGFGDDMVSIEYPEDLCDVVRGADGAVTRVLRSVSDIQITFTLKQSSLSNDFFSNLVNADRLTGAGVLPFLLDDGAGNTKIVAAQCFVKKLPTIDFGNSAKDRVWILHTSDDVVMSIGGN